MPDSAGRQANGLVLSRQHNARLTAMVSHGDETSELPLLWRLCMAWVDLGYPVTVLDAGTRESAENPGLENLLDMPGTQLTQYQDATAWNVIPSAIGLQTLVDSPKKDIPLEYQLGGLFADDGIVVVYASASMLAQLLNDQNLHPLMTVSSARASLLTGYQSLKRLLGTPGLTPLVVDQATRNNLDTVRSISAAETLADCARNFLSLELSLVHLPAPTNDGHSSTDQQGLALRVLEDAIALCGRKTLNNPTGAKMDTWQISRNH